MSSPEPEQVESTPQRDVVIERFATLGRQLSQATVLFHEQIAEHVGLSATDHKCLDLAVQAERPLTAGQIDDRTQGGKTAFPDSIFACKKHSRKCP